MDDSTQNRHSDTHGRDIEYMTTKDCGKKHMRVMTIIISSVLVLTSSITAWGVGEGKEERLRMEQVVEVAIERIRTESNINRKEFEIRMRMLEQSDAVNSERFKSIQMHLAEIKQELHERKTGNAIAGCAATERNGP